MKQIHISLLTTPSIHMLVETCNSTWHSKTIGEHYKWKFLGMFHQKRIKDFHNSSLLGPLEELAQTKLSLRETFSILLHNGTSNGNDSYIQRFQSSKRVNDDFEVDETIPWNLFQWELSRDVHFMQFGLCYLLSHYFMAKENMGQSTNNIGNLIALLF